MPPILTMWAKTAVGTNLGFLKGYGKALKSWKDVLQQTVWKRVCKAQPHISKSGKISKYGKERCHVYSTKLTKFSESLSGRVMRVFISSTNSKITSNTLAHDLRRRMACKLFSSNSFRNVPLFSLIGISLGLDSATLIANNTEKVLMDMKSLFSSYSWEAEALDNPPKSLQDLVLSPKTLATGCEGAVYKAKVKTEVSKGNEDGKETEDSSDFDLAVKAVFNYGTASNADIILREMHREYVPLHMKDIPENTSLAARVGRLPPHPNIVDMPGVFEDEVLVTEEGLKKFPAAMPRKHDPHTCFGRNKTLYVVMRRRTTHLRDYLATHEVSMTTRCLLLAQLLEGVAHLAHHGIAHRDLKADNLLIDIPNNGGQPKLEICDFGCCLAEESRCLCVPFNCEDVYKGGNSWLMAPEIATATPGPQNVLDYRKSDLWAVGAIAYEILGGENPFYLSPTQPQLSTHHYLEEDLPSLPEDVPDPVQYLVFSLLSRNPQMRPKPSVAAAMMNVVALDLCFTSSDGCNNLQLELQSLMQTNRPAAVFRAQCERTVFQWLVDQSQALTCQLTLSCDNVWDVPQVMRFLFLSRLTHQDFRKACGFF